MFGKCRGKKRKPSTTKETDPQNTSEENSDIVIQRRNAFQHADARKVELVRQDNSESDVETITNALKSNDFLMSLASKAIGEFAQYMTLQEVTKSEVILHQGQEGDTMYVSKYGEFIIQIDSQEIATFNDNHCFGELAILYNKPRVASVIAATDGAVWKLTREQFQAVLSQFNITALNNLVEFCRKVPALKALSQPKLQKIAELCETIYYNKDTVIVRENDRGDEFFIVKSGAVVVSQSENGILATYDQAGDCFGERALLHNDDKRQATVTAGEYGVECIVITRKDFNEFLGDFRKYFEPDDNRVVVNLPKYDKKKYEYIKLEKLEQLKFLGRGNFGVVHLVKCERNQKFALKSMSKQKLIDNNIVDTAEREKDIMRMCDSPFIVKLYRALVDTKNCYFLLEYCPYKDLFTLLYDSKARLKPKHSKFIVACVVEALIYLHQRNIAFLDLKAENICIDRKFYAKLLDFGIAAVLKPGEKCFSSAGTLEYAAPENYQRKGVDKASDYWALGVLIYELHKKITPFKNANEETMTTNISKGLTAKHLTGLDVNTADIIKKLMHLTPAKRLGCQVDGAHELRNHTYFKDIDFVKLREFSIKSPLKKFFK